MYWKYTNGKALRFIPRNFFVFCFYYVKHNLFGKKIEIETLMLFMKSHQIEKWNIYALKLFAWTHSNMINLLEGLWARMVRLDFKNLGRKFDYIL